MKKYIALAKDKNSHFQLMGFGHRVYKNFDPRAKIIKAAADKVLSKLGRQGSAPRHRQGAGRGRAERQLLRRAKALSERRFLLGHHLSRDGRSRPTCLRCCSPWDGSQAGSPTGKR